MSDTQRIVRALIEGPAGPEWSALGLPTWDKDSECWRDQKGRFSTSPHSRIALSDRPQGVAYYNPQAFRTIRGL